MILPDVNILVHAYNPSSTDHRAARLWWEESLSLPRPVGLSWIVILGFIRVTTNRRIFDRPARPGEVIHRVRGWLNAPAVQILIPGERHPEILFELLEHVGAAGDLTTDAHLAALALEHQAEVASTDTDFARFPRLRWFNPLAPHQRRER